MELKDNNLYYIGGVVRDEILETPSFDVDYCYEGDAIKFSEHLNVIKTNPDFGTVRIKYEDKEIDIASTRFETYPQKGHLPVVENIGCALKDDLSRRDFTINALAKNTVTGEIVDYFNGLEDIKNKKLRVLHNNSFIDDPSRIIRGLKFSVRFGFELEENTKKLQDEYLKNVNYDMSFHRIKKELKETFNLNKYLAYEKFVEQGIYKLLGDNQIPKKIDSKVEELVLKYQPEHTWLIYLGLYNLSNFEHTVEEKTIIESYQKISNLKFKSDYEIYKEFKTIPLESILIYGITIDYCSAIKYLDNLSKIQLEITGDDLLELGIKQGKVYKEIFDYVLEYKLKNQNISKPEELELVKKWVSDSL